MTRWLSACALLLGCDAGPMTYVPRPLAAHRAWEHTPAELDPEPDHRPDEILCTPHPWRLEGAGIEIDTTGCNYVSLSQPLPRDVAEGDSILIDAWWNTLASVEPAHGHLGVYIDDVPLWSEWVPIPGPASTRSIEVQSPIDAAAGDPLTIHLHNHGYNTWRFVNLQVLEEVSP